MAKKVSVEVEVNSSQIDKTVSKLGQLKDLGRGLKIQYDIDGKPIDIVIDKSLNLQKQVKVLTAELRRTKEGTAEFQLLSTRLGDAQDQLAKTTAKSKDLFSSLSMIPGPVGDFFSQLQGGIELLKTFSSFTFKDLTFQFKETANDIADIGKNLSSVNGDVLDDIGKSAETTSKNVNTLGENVEELGQQFQKSTDDIASSAAANKTLGDTISRNAVVYSKLSGEQNTIAKGLDQIEGKFQNVNTRIVKGIPQIQTMTGAYRNLTEAELLAVKSGKALTLTTDGLIVAEKTATFWTSTLGTTIKTVLISTGVLAAIVVIGQLVSLIYNWATGTKEAEEATRNLTNALEEQQRVLQNDMDALEMSNKAMITRAKIAGKSEQEIYNLTKKGAEERLKLLQDYDNQLYKDQETLAKNTKIKGEERAKLNKDINDKILKNGQDITKQILTIEQLRLDEQLRVADKGRENSKKIQEKKLDDTKTALEMLRELEQSNAVSRETEERQREFVALQNSKSNEEKKINELKISEELRGKLLTQVREKYALKILELGKKYEEEGLKKLQEEGQKRAEWVSKLEDIRIQAIADAYQREVQQRQNKFEDEKKELDKALKDKLISQEQYNQALLNLQKSLDNDLKKLEEDKKKKEQEEKIKKLDDELKFLQIRNEATRKGTIAFFDSQREILAKSLERELAQLDLTEQQKTDIKKKYANLRKEIDRSEFETYLGYLNQGLNSVQNILGQTNQIRSLEQQNELDRLQINFNKQQEFNSKTITSKEEFDKQTIKNEKELAKQQDEVKEKYFYRNRNAQYAQAMISAFQSAISAYSAMAAIPVVGPALGAAAAAVALAFGIKQANLIKQQEYVSTVAAEYPERTGGMANYGRNYEKGGMIGGKRHAEGGTLIEAEKGEAIMTRGAVTMFAPLLSTLNQMGGGTSFAPSLMTTSYDAPITTKPTQEQSPIIVKSYVISNELTSEQQKQARLKDLSTL